MTFVDDAHGGDGTTYAVLTADLLSEDGIAALMREQRRMGELFAADQSEEALASMNRMLAILIPTLPPERLKAIPVTFKTKFLDFWQAEHPAADPKPPATSLPTSTPHGRRSRGSSRPTA
jgi:hypothetical protein